MTMDLIVQLARWFGSAVCHQWVSHSYTIGGMPLCLCARCTGMYLGALLTIGYLKWCSPRAAQLPRVPYLVAFLLFFSAWAGDGANSFLTELWGAPFLYQPQNLLRLVTGTLMGIALGSLLTMMLNSTLYRDPAPKPLFTHARDFFTLLLLAVLLVVVVNSQVDLLWYPLAALMLAAILIVNASVWTAFAAGFMRAATRPRDLLRPVAVGATIAVVLLSAIALARVLMGIALGAPI